MVLDDFADLSFEEAFAELQRTLEDLRGDALTLDRSITLFERGNALAEHCNRLLTAAELRVTTSSPDAPAPLVRDVFDLDTGW